MFLMIVESIYIPSKVKHTSKALVATKELGETLVKSWQLNRGKDYEIHIISMDEVNPKKHKDVGTYVSTEKFIPPKELEF